MDGSIAVLDLQRMVFGDEPWTFGLEVLVRTLVIYTYALILLRWLGSRTIGQLSTIEFLLVIALGSAVGDPMFYPDVPLFYALLVVTLVVFANKGLDLLVASNKNAERLIDGRPVELISHGVIARRFLRSRTMGHSEIFQQLRHNGIEHLGQVRWAFIEPNGATTVFRQTGDVPPGLPIVPPWEVRPPAEVAGDEAVPHQATLACINCGNTKDVAGGSKPGPCLNCGHVHWTGATPAETSDR